MSTLNRKPNDLDMMALLVDAMGSSTGGAIERSEARGQVMAVNSQELPVKGSGDPGWAKIGVTFGPVVSPGDLFVQATLPPGWTKRATDHSMWNDIIDDKGRRRGQFFYKAAFYDRSAHLSGPYRRYTVQRIYSDDRDLFQAQVLDGETEIHRTEAIQISEDQAKDWKARDAANAKATDDALAWLTERYPDHADPSAYWD